MSYQTAWLKAHYPAAFMAAVLSWTWTRPTKVVVFIGGMPPHGLKLVPPAINASGTISRSVPVAILYGLGAIKGAGEGAIEALWRWQSRRAVPRLFDLCQRWLRKLNRRVLEALVLQGPVDELGVNRATLMAQLPEALRLSRAAFPATTPLARTICSGWPPPRKRRRGRRMVLSSKCRPKWRYNQVARQMPPAGCSGNHVQREWDEEGQLRGEGNAGGVP